MKKYGKIAYVMLILIIFVCGFCIYKVSAKNDSQQEINEKTFEEIKYLENELQNLFNEINNIKFENYTISATNIEENEQSEESSNESSGSSKEKQTEGGTGENSSEKQTEGSTGGNSSGNTSENEQEKTTNKQYQLKEEGILTKNQDINWSQIKNDVEKIYTVLYSTTIDLYQVVENKDEITNFNKEYDNLTKAVKEEDKKETLKRLSAVYEFLPKFVENCAGQEKDKVVIKTKNYIFKAYSILEEEQWQNILDNINSAQQEFMKIASNVNNKEKQDEIILKQNGNKYNIDKSYIMINELKNAVELKDKQIFLIKYKNLLEELENV